MSNLDSSRQRGREKIREALKRGFKSGGDIGDIGGGTGAVVVSTGGGRGGVGSGTRSEVRRVGSEQAQIDYSTRKLQEAQQSKKKASNLRQDIIRSLLQRQGKSPTVEKGGNIVVRQKGIDTVISPKGEIGYRVSKELITRAPSPIKKDIAKQKQNIKKIITTASKITGAVIAGKKTYKQPQGKVLISKILKTEKTPLSETIVEKRGGRLVIKSKDTFLGKIKKAIDKFQERLNKSKKQVNRTFRDLQIKENSGKKLTAQEKAARVIGQYNNIALGIISGLASIPIAASRPTETYEGLKQAVSNPRKVLSIIGEQIVRNPVGFASEWVGASLFLGGVGKVVKTGTKVTKAGLKYTIKGTKGAARGAIKLTSNGARGTIKVITNTGRKIVDKTRNIKLRGKSIIPIRKMSVAKLEKLRNSYTSALKSLEQLKRLTKGKAISKAFKETIKNLEDKVMSLERKLKIQAGGKTAAVRDITLAQRQALRLKRLLDENLKKIQKTKISDAARKKLIKSMIKKAGRRARVKLKRRAKLQAGRKGRKEFRKQFQKRNFINTLKKSADDVKELAEMTSKTTGKNINLDKISKLSRYMQIRMALEQARAELSKRTGDALRMLFRKMDKKGQVSIGKLKQKLKISQKSTPAQATKLKKRAVLETAKEFEQMAKEINRVGSKLIEKSTTKLQSGIVRKVINTGSNIAKASQKAIIAYGAGGAATNILSKAAQIGKIRSGVTIAPISKQGSRIGTIIGQIKKAKQDAVQKGEITIKSEEIPKNITDSTLRTIINGIISTVALGGVGAFRIRGKIIKVPQTRLRGGTQNLAKYIFNKIKKMRKAYTPDVYSLIFGIKARPNEKIKLMRKGRVFTGLETRKI